jgi:hypothetical protein
MTLLQGLAEVAVQFWEGTLDANAADSLARFGWYAEVESINIDIWVELTLRTVEAARGRIDRGTKSQNGQRRNHRPRKPSTSSTISSEVSATTGTDEKSQESPRKHSGKRKALPRLPNTSVSTQHSPSAVHFSKDARSDTMVQPFDAQVNDS